MNAFLKNKGLIFYIRAVIAFMGIIALVSYVFANKIDTPFVLWTYAIGIIAVVCVVLSEIKPILGIFSMLAPAAFVACFICSFIDNATSFMLYFFGVAQGTGEMGAPNVAFWSTVILFLVCAVAMCVTCFLKENK